MRYALAILILALSFAPSMEAAEGRRTAFMGGLVTGLVGGFLARDAMEVKPAPQVVYVESQPRVVYVERPTVVYVEAQPRVVYVERREPTVVVTVEVEGRRHGDCRTIGGWTPPIAHPFPQ